MISDTPVASLRVTPLNAAHRALGARMVDFGGWDMPVEYSGIIAEHLAVRRNVGLFDVSHMGEIEIRGPKALQLVEYVSSNAASRLADGQAQYSGLLNRDGGFVDDILVHRVAQDHFLLCVNASNQDADFDWIRKNNQIGAEIENSGARYVQLALQGPKAIATLSKLTDVDLDSIRYYWFVSGKVDGVDAIIARTGYTGEDGFELYFAPEHGERIWHTLLEAGEEFGILPCGLGARNTLRLESAMSLYGHEINETTTPYEAGLKWIVKLNKGDFIGRDALVNQKATGTPRKLIGFEMVGRGIARDGYPVEIAGEPVGFVSSGSPAPFLEKNIGLALIPIAAAKVGDKIEIAVRSRKVEALVVSTPFYSRKK